MTPVEPSVFSSPHVTDVLTSLGCALYVLIIIGLCAIPGAITIIVPGLLRIKEWAYAGMVRLRDRNPGAEADNASTLWGHFSV